MARTAETSRPHLSRTAPFEARTLDELLKATPEQIESCDFARMALLCAEGLPGAEDVGVVKYLRILDAWVVRIRATLTANDHKFDENPARWHFSRAKHKMALLAAVLQHDYNVHYERDKIGKTRKELPDEAWYLNSRDFMLHGVLSRTRSGTCASLPTLLVSIARRLDIPLNLILVPSHILCGWDDPVSGEIFNFDWNGDGVGSHADDYYHNWPVKWVDWMHEEQRRLKVFLRSLTPVESLAVMLSERGACLEANARPEDALAAYDAAARLFPNHYELARHANEVCLKMGIHPVPSRNQQPSNAVTWGLAPPSRLVSVGGLPTCTWGSRSPQINGTQPSANSNQV